VFNFIVARRIAASAWSAAPTGPLLLIFGIVVDVLMLATSIHRFPDRPPTPIPYDFMLQQHLAAARHFVLHLQKIAYLVDSARGEVAEHDFLEYASS